MNIIFKVQQTLFYFNSLYLHCEIRIVINDRKEQENYRKRKRMILNQIMYYKQAKFATINSETFDVRI